MTLLEIIIKSFDDAREVKFPAKVFYDVSWNPNVCGTTTVHIGNEDKCNIYDSSNAEVAEIELLSDGSVFALKNAAKLTKTFVQQDLMFDDCTGLKFLQICLKITNSIFLKIG